MQLGDLLDEGVMGLLSAAERFDRRRGVQFSTYAMWWVKERIRRAIDQQDELVRYRPNRTRDTDLQPEVVSLREVSHGEIETALARDRSQEPVDGGLRDGEFHRQIALGLARLQPRECTVLIASYGLFGCPQCTLAEVGEILRLTRVQIVRIQRRAKSRLRILLKQLEVTAYEAELIG